MNSQHFHSLPTFQMAKCDLQLREFYHALSSFCQKFSKSSKRETREKKEEDDDDESEYTILIS